MLRSAEQLRGVKPQSDSAHGRLPSRFAHHRCATSEFWEAVAPSFFQATAPANLLEQAAAGSHTARRTEHFDRGRRCRCRKYHRCVLPNGTGASRLVIDTVLNNNGHGKFTVAQDCPSCAAEGRTSIVLSTSVFEYCNSQGPWPCALSLQARPVHTATFLAAAVLQHCGPRGPSQGFNVEFESVTTAVTYSRYSPSLASVVWTPTCDARLRRSLHLAVELYRKLCRVACTRVMDVSGCCDGHA